MDVSTFYALFSATCFTLTGLWWSVVEKHRHWLRDPGIRWHNLTAADGQ